MSGIRHLRPFGMQLLRLRRASGLQGVTVAATVGCDPSYLTRLEQGEREPSRSMALALANVLTLDRYERAQLVCAAGYLPEVDPAFTHMICLMASRWSEDKQSLQEQVRQATPKLSRL